MSKIESEETMKKLMKLMTAVAVAIAAEGAMAATALDREVRLGGYGVVKMTCADTKGWTFDLRCSTSDLQPPTSEILELRFTAKGAKAELPPAVRLEHVMEQRDVQFRWDSYRHSVPIPWLEPYGDLLASTISLTPVYAWISQTDRNRLTVSLSEAIRPTLYSAYETDKPGSQLHNVVTFFSRGGEPLADYEAVIRFDFRDLPFWRTVAEGADWVASFPGQQGRTPPREAYEPYWNSWYGYHIGYTADDILAEAKIAKELGVKTIMYDMGWDRHGSTNSSSFAACGDWRPDPQDFPDLKANVAAVHALGLKAMLWLGPALMGKDAKNVSRFKEMLLNKSPTICGTCYSLDPAFPEVREFLTRTIVDGFKDWDIDGWKIDFIQDFRGRDGAVRGWLEDVHDRVAAVKPNAMFEYMMAYAGLMCQRAATQIRAGDCPCDAVCNREQTVRLRLLCGGRCAVLADMFTWSVEEAPEACALQMIATLHAVPMLGMRLTELTEGQKRMVRHYLDFARAHADTLYRGEFRPHGAAAGYPLIEMESAKERIVTVHQAGMAAAARLDKSVYVFNGTGADGLLVECNRAATAEIFDAFGEARSTVRFAAPGIRRLPVPRGGYVRFAVKNHPGEKFKNTPLREGGKL